MASKNFPASSLAMQRASIEITAALMSSGNSRNTKCTLPVSIYFDRSIGKTFSSNAAQCGQLIDAYSTMVTEALTGPSAISGSDAGLAASAAVAFCALATSTRWSGVNATKAASPASESAALKARRTKVKDLLRNGGGSHAQIAAIR